VGKTRVFEWFTKLKCGVISVEDAIFIVQDAHQQAEQMKMWTE
jgi:hypothetical protein